MVKQVSYYPFFILLLTASSATFATTTIAQDAKDVATAAVEMGKETVRGIEQRVREKNTRAQFSASKDKLKRNIKATVEETSQKLSDSGHKTAETVRHTAAKIAEAGRHTSETIKEEAKHIQKAVTA